MALANSQLPHNWMHQRTNRQGEVAGFGSNTHYVGTSYYSYSTKVAEMYPELGAILITSNFYSSSTSKQLAYLRRAIDLTKFSLVVCVPELGPFKDETLHADNVAYLVSRMAEATAKAKKANRHKLTWLHHIETTRMAALEYCRTFRLAKLALTIPALPEDYNDQCVKAVETGRILAERECKKREADRAAKVALEVERLAEWRMRKGGYRYFTTTALRISADGEQIETTRGARIPVKAAIRLWPFLERAHRTGVAITSEGSEAFHLGYPFYGFGNDVLHVGCHYIPYSEIELMAHELGLVKEVEHETQHS